MGGRERCLHYWRLYLNLEMSRLAHSVSESTVPIFKPPFQNNSPLPLESIASLWNTREYVVVDGEVVANDSTKCDNCYVYC